jgi:hypothetical protein
MFRKLAKLAKLAKILKAWKLGAAPGQKLTSRHLKLASACQEAASGTVQQPNAAAQTSALRSTPLTPDRMGCRSHERRSPD